MVLLPNKSGFFTWRLVEPAGCMVDCGAARAFTAGGGTAAIRFSCSVGFTAFSASAAAGCSAWGVETEGAASSSCLIARGPVAGMVLKSSSSESSMAIEDPKSPVFAGKGRGKISEQYGCCGFGILRTLSGNYCIQSELRLLPQAYRETDLPGFSGRPFLVTGTGH